ncbi:MAG: HD domain-containing protein [Alphaproteobacteria bacterium]|nr:HD domain-containing protein [Alphaproteobacteria bacterium]
MTKGNGSTLAERRDLLGRIKHAAPRLTEAVTRLTGEWLAPLCDTLARGESVGGGFPKILNDPIWGTVELLPWEVALLDSPLLQRLRGVRQLGFAHTVYPGACHDRLEHSRGVLEAADRMMRWLERNAGHRRAFRPDTDTSVPEVTPADRYAIRIAALLHDCGHGPFSHAIEPVFEARHQSEFHALRRVLVESFPGGGKADAAECVAALVVLSDRFADVIANPQLGIDTNTADFPLAIAARIVGSHSYISAAYVSKIVSGPIDADKLDYMARDSHHAGLPIGLDTERLISKLEVVTVTPENAPDRERELRKRAEQAPYRRLFDTGIALSGTGAYEQLIVGRAVLYDRLYYHHKVRAADAMARRLVSLAEEERGEPFAFHELFPSVSDDTMVLLLGGIVSMESFQSGGPRSKELAQALSERRLYNRAFAFASRFLGGVGQLPTPDKETTVGDLWSQINKALATNEAVAELELRIFDRAKAIGNIISELGPVAETLKPEHLILDLPANKSQPGGNTILTRTENDELQTPSLFFDPERWSNAYEQQKRCGYLFCPKRFIPLANLAAKTVFFERFRVVFAESADKFTKTAGLVKPSWIEALANSAVIDAECRIQLTSRRFQLCTIRADEVRLPASWVSANADLPAKIANDLGEIRRGGFDVETKGKIITVLEALAYFVTTISEGGELRNASNLQEAELQADLRKILRARGLSVIEGSEVDGGETDLIVDSAMLVENKVYRGASDPFHAGENYPWQARRYARALCKSVFFTMVAYKPANEAALLDQVNSVQVKQVKGGEPDCIEIRFVVPYGYPRPSDAKAP